MKNILFISYYFPPYSGGSIIRVHNFVKYLPQFNFCPVVLTVDENYYEKIYYDYSLLNEYPKFIKIFRTKSLEPRGGSIKDKVYGLKENNKFDKFIISVFKKIVSNLFIPDYHILWFPYALIRGYKIIKKNDISLIFSTSPPFSSNIIAYFLSRLSGMPLVVDYRDDWVGNEFYSNGRIKSVIAKRLEMAIVKSTAKVVSTTYSSIELFRVKYPGIDRSKYLCVPNGFDPEYFNDYLNKDLSEYRINHKKKIVFTYSGSITIKRDPAFFLRSIKEIITENPKIKDCMQVVFIGFCHQKHKELVKKLSLEEIVTFKNQLSPRGTAKFLQEETDVCLLFQRKSEGAATAIPGKLYEYLASKKPIFCMDDNGATTKFLVSLGSNLNARYEDVRMIKMLINIIINNYQEVAKRYIWDLEFLNKFNRRKQSETLAEHLDNILMNENDRNSK
jgi:glycosyltransferase involved in cell wall biosynthesis